LWLGEHFSATSEPIPSPMMFMASLLPRTDNLRFGTGVVCIPNHNPIVVAAESAQFDHMSRGRFMLGVGPGGLFSDFELFGQTDHAIRNRKVVEAIRIMREIWSQDPPYDIAGEFWNVRLKNFIPELGIGYMPKPYQKGGPPISISLASPHSSSARTAALNDCGIISANITPTYSVALHWRSTAKYARKPANGFQVKIGAWLAISWSRRPTRRPTTACSASVPPTTICLITCAPFFTASASWRS
jgi:alkanesulfonate monooxygenase SsuD/methylene tetrahydromethanopterin reductase-like flavin-dependent oxidoreductase (luciferase family)